MSFVLSQRAFDRIRLLDGSPVVPFTGVRRVRPAARPQVPRVVENGIFVEATIALPGFPRVRIPRAFVDRSGMKRESKPADFRRSHERLRREIRKAIARYTKR